MVRNGAVAPAWLAGTSLDQSVLHFYLIVLPLQSASPVDQPFALIARMIEVERPSCVMRAFNQKLA